MASQIADVIDDETITRGTGNVFADLGIAEVDERQTKLRLAHAADDVIARQRRRDRLPTRRRWTQPRS